MVPMRHPAPLVLLVPGFAVLAGACGDEEKSVSDADTDVDTDSDTDTDTGVDEIPGCGEPGAPDDGALVYEGHVEVAQYVKAECPPGETSCGAAFGAGPACCPAGTICVTSPDGTWMCSNCANGEPRQPCNRRSGATSGACNPEWECGTPPFDDAPATPDICSLPCTTHEDCAPLGAGFCCVDLCEATCGALFCYPTAGECPPIE